MHESMPMPENGQREFQDQTGINVETDIDRVVGCFKPGNASMTSRAREWCSPAGGSTK